MSLKIITAVILIFCAVPFSYCQDSNNSSVKTFHISKYDTFHPPINFEFFDHTDGLATGMINSLTQTKDGYVWLSIWGYGLVRYDGYRFRSFAPDTKNSSSIPTKIINGIVKSKRDGLWLFSYDGLFWFDFKTYKSKPVKNLLEKYLNKDVHLNKDEHFAWYGVEDTLGYLWIFGRGLFMYDPATEKLENIQKGFDGITGKQFEINGYFYDNSFGSPVLGNDGSFWINGYEYLFHIYPGIKKVVRYPKIKKNFDIDILPDPDGENVWVSGYGGIQRYNFKENTYVEISFRKNNVEKYNFCYIDEGKLWMRHKNEIIAMDCKTFKARSFKNEELFSAVIKKGISSTVWIYGNNKLLCYFLEASRFSYQKILPSDECVLSFFSDKKNDIEWFGTTTTGRPLPRGMLYKHDLISNKVSAFVIPSQPCQPLVLTRLNSDDLLIGVAAMTNHKGRLYKFNTKSESFKVVSKKIFNNPDLTTDSLEYLGACIDKQNNIWFSIHDTGLLKYEIATDKFYMIINATKELIPKGETYGGSFWSGDNEFFYNDGFIWMSGQKNILKKINTATGDVQEIRIPGVKTGEPLCIDLNGNIYLNAGDGVSIYNIASNKLERIPNFSYCYKAVIDSNNNMIGLGYDGLWLYNSALKTLRCFNAKDGLKGSNTFNLPNTNELLIDDVYRLPVKFLYPRKEVPLLHFTSIKIFGKELITTKNVDALNTLKLKYNENQLTLEFAALSFLPHNANSYACMLQGLDASWQQLGSNNTVTYANLAPGKYTFKVKTANRDGVWGKERMLHIIIVPAFWQTTWFKVLVVLFSMLVVAGILYWLYRNRLRQLNLKYQLEQEKLQQQKREAKFEKRLADLTLSALRSQINPHFIFNCLNSIKLYATQNDINAATDYLTKFSRLIRQVLENSRNDKISLASELEVLRLYIEMEAMRFKEKLKYSISVEKNVEADYIEIPPLLLQPYVENAIWHGLMPKEEGGHLDIVAAMNDDSTLRITIKDDGIGRARSAELKSNAAMQHKSFGMKITSERMALINQMYKTVSSVTIDDLTDSKGEPAGTLVTIQIQV